MKPLLFDWLLLSASAAFQVVWVISLKYCDGAARIVPLAAYAISGLGTAVLFSLAMRSIPMGTAYAIWMSLSLVGTLLVDVALFHQPWNAARAVSALLILAGTCGLKLSASP